MKAKLKKKWVAALRSGRYKQGTGCLKRGQKYCCLGVLASVMGKKKISNRDLLSDLYVDAKRCPLSESQEDRLANMNDAGKSFKAIATYIEKRIPVTK